MKRLAIVAVAVSFALMGVWSAANADMGEMHHGQNDSSDDSSMSHDGNSSGMDHGDHAAMESGNEDTPLLDPVCGMWTSVESAHKIAEKDGQTFAFCMASHQATFDANPSQVWDNNWAQSSESDGYRVNIHLMTMSAHHRTMEENQATGTHMSGNGTHHMNIQILDEAGNVVDDVVVTVKATLGDAARGGSLVRATMASGLYEAGLQLDKSGEYTIAVAFTGDDSVRRVVTMPFTNR